MRRVKGAGLAAALALALFASADRAAASAFSVEGFGPVGVAEVGARAAHADDGTATFYNPGGLGLGRGVRVEIAPTLAISALSAQDKNPGIEDAFGVALAFDATVPFEGVLRERLRFGLGVYVMGSGLARVLARPETAPLFPYFDNRTQRLVALPALAVKLARGLSIGGGVDVLGGVSGTADVSPGASGAAEPRIDLDGATRLSAVLGARWDPADFAHFGLVFRQRSYVPAKIATSAEVGGLPLAIDVGVAQALFDPDTFVVAAGFDVGRTSLELDASYAVWSAYAGPVVALHAELPAVSIDGGRASPPGRDVVAIRGAASRRFDVGRHALTLRGGLGFEPSMLAAGQQGETNLLDGDKIFVGGGASFELTHVLGRALRFGAALNATIVTEYRQDKRACAAAPCAGDAVSGPDAAHPSVGITNPGYPTLHGGGALLATSLSVGVDL